MKRHFTFLFFPLLISITGFSQTIEWTWVSGTKVTDDYSGTYGTQGVPSVNNIPAARNVSNGWADSSNNLWIFGGFGLADLNDLWKYSITTNQWTWMKGSKQTSQPGQYGVQGVPAPANTPGARCCYAAWQDNSKNLYLFGGQGHDYIPSSIDGLLNDLWKYDMSTNQWTWLKGDSLINKGGSMGAQGVTNAANNPGARRDPLTWKDKDGNFWLFGGDVIKPHGVRGAMNDLWKYNITTNQWTWVKGDTTTLHWGVNGTKGVPAVANNPKARKASVTWTDTAGNFWLYGGNYGENASYNNSLNDLWRYNPATNEWTWMNGDTLFAAPASYGTMGVPAASNQPGGRSFCTGWKDKEGNFYLFGGLTNSITRMLNDVWKYNIATNEWTWIKGNNIPNQKGVYGTQGTPSNLNMPGGRVPGVTLTDSAGNFWLFGGNGYTTFNNPGMLNDLWKFSVNSALPVQLISFDGSWQNGGALLNWRVANEVSFSHYEVERSFNSQYFSMIGTVKANGGISYSFTDESNELAGRTVFYRLKLVEKDGKYRYSSIFKLSVANRNVITVFPNPANETTRLLLDKNVEGVVQLQVIDLLGKVVVSRLIPVNGTNIPLSIHALAAGTYTVKLVYNHDVYSTQLVVHK